MELTLKSNNIQSIAKIIALAKELDVAVEEKAEAIEGNVNSGIKERILTFRATTPSSFGDVDSWQKEQRQDRNLPFS